MKNRLRGFDEEVTRWEKITYRPDKKDALKKTSVRSRRSVLFVDTAVMRAMLDQVGLSANRIAYLMMDESMFGSNVFIGTYEEIGEKLNLGRNSVITGMHELLQADFIRKVRNGRWMLNPAVGAKCYAEDVDTLRDTYSAQHPYTPKKVKGVENNVDDA